MSKPSRSPAKAKSKSPKPRCSTPSRNGVVAQLRKLTNNISNKKEKETQKTTSKTDKILITQRSTGTNFTQDFSQEDRDRRKIDVNSLNDVAPTLSETKSDRGSWQGSVRHGIKENQPILLTAAEKKKRCKIFKAMWDELEKEEFFHGLIPLEDMQSLLHEDGDFLVRKLSDDIKSTPPILTVMWNTTLYHLPLYRSQQGKKSAKFTLNTHDYCSSYSNLIKMHWMQKVPVFKGIILITRAPRKAWELTRDNVSLEEKIGEGVYGEVWKGRLKTRIHGKVATITVAVKIVCLKQSYTREIAFFVLTRTKIP
ncbi:hypothetical protein Y032_0287g1429 [Ancylostoma ceylanicum]|uniref:SH2 domain-containing protein n=1 Tax=Ancylostoma ceylanicum TaxID=53326 RepID=A0A016S5K8_9BILA|nr:hypothetical protein Y032_0287g1429 [Ancylostoma ceylanicum]